MEKEKTILEEWFSFREEELAEEKEKDREVLKPKLKPIHQEQIIQELEKLPEEYKEIKQKVEQQVDDLIVNYNIKIAYYNKKYYQSGFRDAIELNQICTQKEK